MADEAQSTEYTCTDTVWGGTNYAPVLPNPNGVHHLSMIDGGTAGTTTYTVTIPKAEIAMTGIVFYTPALNLTAWDRTLSNVTVSLSIEVITGNPDLTYRARFIRYTPPLGGILWTPDMGYTTVTAGNHLFSNTVSSNHSPTNLTDVFIVEIQFTNAAAHADSAMQFKASLSCFPRITTHWIRTGAALVTGTADIQKALHDLPNCVFCDDFTNGVNGDSLTDALPDIIGTAWTPSTTKGSRSPTSVTNDDIGSISFGDPVGGI